MPLPQTSRRRKARGRAMALPYKTGQTSQPTARRTSSFLISNPLRPPSHQILPYLPFARADFLQERAGGDTQAAAAQNDDLLRPVRADHPHAVAAAELVGRLFNVHVG